MPATGSLGPLLTAALTVAGVVGMIASSRARRARRSGTAPTPPEDLEAEQRRAARAETERRMAAYLASRPRATDQED
jgi:hypothetical protein